MYYDEKVIEGILCHRGTPDGEWIQFTPQELTERVVEAEKSVGENLAGWMEADAKLRKCMPLEVVLA